MSYKIPQKNLINGLDIKTLFVFVLLEVNAAENLNCPIAFRTVYN